MQYQLITDADGLREYLTNYDESQVLVQDTETTGLKVHSKLLGISLYQPALKKPCFILVDNGYYVGRGIKLSTITEILNPILKNSKGVFHNAKFDLGIYQMNNIDLPELCFDTQIAVHLTDADRIKKLETVVKEDFGYEKKDFKTLTGLKWDKIVWNSSVEKYVPLDILAEYASEDVYWTYALYEKYKPILEQMEVTKVFERIELPLVHVLKDMKLRGVRIQKQVLYDMQKRCAKNIKKLETDIYKLAGAKFNINSPKQVGEILYKKMKYKPPKFTKSGAASCDADALEILAKQGCGVAVLLSEYSGLTTLQSSFIDAIPDMVDFDGYLRCDFNSTGARTGRFSSSSPNLQNQPNNSEYPVRAAFIPTDGYLFAILDWSQIELRIAAHLSKDAKLIAAFHSGRDIHQEVADQLGVRRKEAKAINFGILYGLGAANLALNIGGGCTEAQAQKILDTYYETYTGIAAWKRYVENNARKDGFVRNMFGRVRPLRGVKSDNKKQFYGALRAAVNTIVQGSSADLMKLAMNRIHAMFKDEGLDAHILMTVHDELIIEAKSDIANDVFWKVKHIMENVIPMRVPILAEGKVCTDWSQMKDDDFKGYQIEEESGDVFVAPVTVYKHKTKISGIELPILTTLLN